MSPTPFPHGLGAIYGLETDIQNIRATKLMQQSIDFIEDMVACLYANNLDLKPRNAKIL